MKIVTSEVGSGAVLSTYYERQVRRKEFTPRTFLDRGIFFDLPYSKDQTAFRQTTSPMLLWGNTPSMYGDVSIASIGMTRQYSTVPSFPIEAEVISKLAGEWRNTDLNIGMYLSPEGRESVTTISDSLIRIANCARQLKRGDFGGAMRNLNHIPRSARQKSFRKYQLGDLSGSFLAAHLGWEPLIKDAFTAADISPPVETGKRIKATKLGNRGTSYIVAKPFGAEVPYTKSFVDIRRTTYIGDVSRPPSFVERFGLGNPFQIAWELVPLSFVADYFVPIGSVIDSMYFISQARFSGLWRKTYSLSKSEVEVPVAGLKLLDQYWRPTWNSSPLRREEITEMFTRSPHVLSFSDPLRSMNVKLPSSLMKLSTLTALVHQRLLSLDDKPYKGRK